MKAVFADTFYWVAVTNIQDRAHEQAKSFALSAPSGIIYTTEEVLTKYLNYFAAWGSLLRRKVADNVSNMLESSTVEIVQQTTGSFLTDCISMNTMRKRGIGDVLTKDRHFEQEGFRALFR